jgi:hypothetical protein
MEKNENRYKIEKRTKKWKKIEKNGKKWSFFRKKRKNEIILSIKKKLSWLVFLIFITLW